MKTNDKRYEALKQFIAQYKEMCHDELVKKEDKGLDADFLRGEMCAYKMIEEFTKHLDICDESKL